MDPIPATSLLHLDHFAAGMARDEIARDPAHSRRNTRTFGSGPHFCIGHRQARMNPEVMTAEIASRWTNLRLVSPPVHFRSNFMDGFESMQVAFDPTREARRSD